MEYKMSKVRREAIIYFRNKRREYLKEVTNFSQTIRIRKSENCTEAYINLRSAKT
jgi:hypothetical protein